MASFGEELRRHRELRSISLREIADATKINIRFLEALEANDFKHLPGGQFNKGFIRAYANHIGVEGEGMVDSYLMEMKHQDQTEKALGKAASPKRGTFVNARVLGVLAVLTLLGAAIATVAGVWIHFKGRKASAIETSAPQSVPGSVAEGKDGGKPAASPPLRDPTATAGSLPESAGGPAAGSTANEAPATNAATPDAGRVEIPAASVPPVEAPGAAAAPNSEPGRSGSTPSPRGQLALEEGAAGSAITLFITPLERTRMTLACNGKENFSGTIEPGRSLSQKCQGVFEISMDNAGAANFFLNGERIYIGRAHQAIAGRHISLTNYVDFIQPPGGGVPK